ncbi:riboflavin biosynthesis protein RibF, partial [Pelagibacteraceae bacterium]|nr:riboflavin biosynthesis protein RibF [Pelagibacteraceae bacterium]
DFKFGKDRLGNFKILEHYSKENNFNVHLVESITPFDSSDKFSSSIIRENIKNGEMEKANFALGRHWHMTGLIVEGDKRARKINFPTANVLPGNHIIPRKGVYCIEAYVKNQKYLGISNFGERPTVDGSKLLLETHIFNFNEEIYGNELTVRFLTFIRPEQKFANFDELAKQIKKDIETAKKYHNI